MTIPNVLRDFLPDFNIRWQCHSCLAFYVFMVEFTNQVYHREVFRVHKWSIKDSPEEVFGLAGRGQTLYSKAARLRQARYPNVPGVRAVLPVDDAASLLSAEA